MSKPRKIKTRSTADRLVSFRDRVRKHWTDTRRGKMSVIPTPYEFEERERRFANMILTEEFVHHSEALKRAERLARLEVQNG
jgi:hypothetical protein